jgi:hypothetical protein
MMALSPGMFLKYKYSPDDIVVRVVKILEKTEDRIIFLGYWDSYNQEQQVVLTKENEGSWEIVK